MTTRAEIIAGFESLIGVPFRWGGRSRRGLDCLGGPLWVARERQVERWQEIWDDPDCHAYGKIRKPGFLKSKLDGFVAAGILRKIDKAQLQRGDMALCCSGDVHDHHVAVVSRPGWIIEAVSKRTGGNRRPSFRETPLTADVWRSIMCGYQFAGIL